jgi:D-alanyl-D-alanine carboxypeptidase/D-alanyl-D-alanine-endopeptidase (penicillin-binding protein 4)
VVSDPVSELTDLPGASVSALAREVGGGTLASHDPDRALAPASNAKLVTTALALHVLGPDHRFETRAVGRGAVDGDRLDGDLVLVGSGQPDLSRAALDDLAARVAADVETTTGDVVLDATRFGDQQLGPGWTWGDEQYYYGARSAALAVDRNLVSIEITGDAGDIAVGIAPDTSAVTVETDLEPGADDLRAYIDHDTGRIRVEGTIPPNADRVERVPVARPVDHCGAAFREALADAGVAVAGEVRRGTASDEPAFEAAVESAPVADLVREMNVPSDNFVAEQLARAVAVEREGAGTWAAWNDVATEFLDSLGVEAHRIRDGSGLSRYDLLSARGLVELFGWVRDREWAEDFFGSLPAPGEGTLEARLGDVDGVRAKTGTITGTSALSGLVRREGEPDVVFSVVFGGLTVEADAARERQDAFVRALR